METLGPAALIVLPLNLSPRVGQDLYGARPVLGAHVVSEVEHADVLQTSQHVILIISLAHTALLEQHT